MRLDLEHEVQVARQGLGINRQRVVNRRQLIRGKFDVNDRADDTHDATGSALLASSSSFVSICSAI